MNVRIWRLCAAVSALVLSGCTGDGEPTAGASSLGGSPSSVPVSSAPVSSVAVSSSAQSSSVASSVATSVVSQAITPRSQWVLTGSPNANTALAVDDDTATRWSTREQQKPGQSFVIDLTAEATFSGIALDSQTKFPKALAIYASNNNSDWGQPIYTGAGAEGVMSLAFAPVTKRYIRIEQTGQSNIWWNIYDLNIVHDGGSSSAGNPEPAGNVDNGRSLYNSADLACAACHGADGTATLFKVIDPTSPTYSHSTAVDEMLSLKDYLTKWMPPNPAVVCDETCARDIAAYIRTFEVVAPPTSTGIAYGKRQMRLLTISEYENTIKDLIGYDIDALTSGMTSDTFVEGFANQTRTAISQGYADAFASMAKEISEYAASIDFNNMVDCSGASRDQCADRFVNQFALKAFRRPLTTAEANRYKALFQADQSESVKQGLTLAVETILGSPYTLMRSEMGKKVAANAASRPNPELDDDSYVLTPYEMATFLAYTYTGSMPDAALFNAAKNNNLATDVQIKAQVERLLQTDRARIRFGEFAAQWLRVDTVLDVVKDEALYPLFTDSIKVDMAREVREIFKHVMFDGNRSIHDLFGDFSFVNKNLADFYGLPGSHTSNFTKVSNLGNRGGVLTSGAFMAGFGDLDVASPIRRAVAIREDILCHDVPEMPNNLTDERNDTQDSLDQFLAAHGGIASNRDTVGFLTSSDACKSCHEAIINPLGFGLEDFSTVGLPMTVDKDSLAIDAAGELIGVNDINDGQTLSFTGARGLSEELKTLDTVRECYAQKAFRYVMGTGHDYFDHKNRSIRAVSATEKQGYRAVLEAMYQTMDDNNYNPRAALNAVAMSDIVKYRK